MERNSYVYNHYEIVQDMQQDSDRIITGFIMDIRSVWLLGRTGYCHGYRCGSVLRNNERGS